MAMVCRRPLDQHSDRQLSSNEAVRDFVNQPLPNHAPRPESMRGSLSTDVLLRIHEHVVSRLKEPIGVADLASIAGRSPFHFSRVFTRSVGVTPHRYVVHLRLHRAMELLLQRELSLAEIAVRTGFADQSHLSRWVRRIYGVSVRQLLHERSEPSDKPTPLRSRSI